MLTVSLLVCAMMALATADDNSTDSKPEVVVAAAPPPAPAPSCPVNFREFNGRCFLFYPIAMSWSDAEKNCQSLKANLASVHSPDENQFLQSYIREITMENRDTWIGASDCQQEGSWLWSDGHAFSHNSWCTGDHVNTGDCVIMNYGANTCWAGVKCSDTHSSMCATNQ